MKIRGGGGRKREGREEEQLFVRLDLQIETNTSFYCSSLLLSSTKHKEAFIQRDNTSRAERTSSKCIVIVIKISVYISRELVHLFSPPFAADYAPCVTV